MYYHFHPSFRRVLVVLLLLAGADRPGGAQGPGWYVGVQGGTSFGQATFASITEHGIHWGAQGGLFAGYGFSRFFSLEAAVQYGAQTQSALDCCPYWLSADGQRYMAPVLDENGWYYRDLGTRTAWGKAALQANFDLLSLLTRPVARWSLSLSPQIAAVTTQTLFSTPDKETQHPRQWHFGYGGQASLGFRFGERVGAAIYGGITSLTGERFDNVPYHAHETNLLWDAGLRLTFHLGKAAPKGPSPDELAAEAARRAAEEAARLAQAEAERLARAKEEEERLAAQKAREEAERLAREQAEREAAAAKDRAFQTPIPTVYFANDSRSIEASYLPPLEEALAILRQYPDFNLEIHAYTSRSGSKAYNDKLSEQRMEAIRSWFTAHGIGLERMGQAYYHGIDYNAPSADKARRAELKFVK